MEFVFVLVLIAACVIVVFWLVRPWRRKGGSASEELARLAELRDSGVLSSDEFEDAKRRVLRRLD